MKTIRWELQCQSTPPALRYCKKCRRKTEFMCSDQFRVNAQKKCLDIWLIYRCSVCETTWNAEVYSRVAPQSLAPELLEGFHRNSDTLVRRYAMDNQFLNRNGAEAGSPAYTVVGDSFAPDQPIELEVISCYPLPIKVSSLIRQKLHLSQKEYSDLIASGTLKSIPGQNLLKCRLHNGIVLIFNPNFKSADRNNA